MKYEHELDAHILDPRNRIERTEDLKLNQKNVEEKLLKLIWPLGFTLYIIYIHSTFINNFSLNIFFLTALEFLISLIAFTYIFFIMFLDYFNKFIPNLLRFSYIFLLNY